MRAPVVEIAFIIGLWEELSSEAQASIGAAAIALVAAKVLMRVPEFACVADEVFRKAAAELRQHVEGTGVLGKFPACWSSLSDEERGL